MRQIRFLAHFGHVRPWRELALSDAIFACGVFGVADILLFGFGNRGGCGLCSRRFLFLDLFKFACSKLFGAHDLLGGLACVGSGAALGKHGIIDDGLGKQLGKRGLLRVGRKRGALLKTGLFERWHVKISVWVGVDRHVPDGGSDVVCQA